MDVDGWWNRKYRQAHDHLLFMKFRNWLFKPQKPWLKSLYLKCARQSSSRYGRRMLRRTFVISLIEQVRLIEHSTCVRELYDGFDDVK